MLAGRAARVHLFADREQRALPIAEVAIDKIDIYPHELLSNASDAIGTCRFERS